MKILSFQDTLDKTVLQRLEPTTAPRVASRNRVDFPLCCRGAVWEAHFLAYVSFCYYWFSFKKWIQTRHCWRLTVPFVLICAFMNHFAYHKNQESSGTVKIMYITETVFKISYTYYKIILFSAPCYDERIIFRNSKISLGSQGFFFFFGGGHCVLYCI